MTQRSEAVVAPQSCRAHAEACGGRACAHVCRARRPEPGPAEARARRPRAVTQACMSSEDRCLSPQSPGLRSVVVPWTWPGGPCQSVLHRHCAGRWAEEQDARPAHAEAPSGPAPAHSPRARSGAAPRGRRPEDCAVRRTGQVPDRGLAIAWGGPQCTLLLGCDNRVPVFTSPGRSGTEDGSNGTSSRGWGSWGRMLGSLPAAHPGVRVPVALPPVSSLDCGMFQPLSQGRGAATEGQDPLRAKGPGISHTGPSGCAACLPSWRLRPGWGMSCNLALPAPAPRRPSCGICRCTCEPRLRLQPSLPSPALVSGGEPVSPLPSPAHWSASPRPRGQLCGSSGQPLCLPGLKGPWGLLTSVPHTDARGASPPVHAPRRSPRARA